MSNVIHANDSDFDSYIQEGVTLVDFFATWCGPCKMLGPEIEKLADAYAGKAKVVKVDVDQAQQIAMRYQVQSIPTLLIFVNGQVVARDMGFKPYPQLENFLKSHLA